MSKNFDELDLNLNIIEGLKKQNITEPTTIQYLTIPKALENKDIIGEAFTGSGKTLAYLVPLFHKINSEKREMQAIVLAPTHELVMQIDSQIKLLNTNSNTTITSLTIMGEANIEKQIKKLKDVKPHIIVGSPGRILDLIKKRKISAHTIKTIVIDEADTLLRNNRTGVIKDIIKSTMRDRQLIFLSASISPEALTEAKSLVKEDVEIIRTEEKTSLNPNIEHICILGENRDRFENLRKLLAAETPKRAIVFVNNNTEMDVLTSKLAHHKVNALYISGKSSKEDRQRAIESFKSGKCNVLVSSDLSARGLDIPDITHIINLDFPNSSNEYLHRAGRTARGLGSGKAISLITVKEIKKITSYENEFNTKFIPARLYMGKLERL